MESFIRRKGLRETKFKRWTDQYYGYTGNDCLGNKNLADKIMRYGEGLRDSRQF